MAHRSDKCWLAITRECYRAVLNVGQSLVASLPFCHLDRAYIVGAVRQGLIQFYTQVNMANL